MERSNVDLSVCSQGGVRVMNKQEFILALQTKLKGLSQSEIDERLVFYAEMIDDRMEDGLKEEQAVEKIGSVDEISKQIITEIPFVKVVKEKIKPKRKFKAWEIVLIALGSPIWFSLLVSLFAVLVSVYAVIWSVAISIFAVEISFAVSSLAGLITSVYLIVIGNLYNGLGFFSATLVLAGLSILNFWLCKALAKGTVLLTKKFAFWFKNLFIKKDIE